MLLHLSTSPSSRNDARHLGPVGTPGTDNTICGKRVRRSRIDALPPLHIKCDPLTIRHQRRTAETFHNSSITSRIPIKILCRQNRLERCNTLRRVLTPWAAISTRFESGPGNLAACLRLTLLACLKMGRRP